MVKDAGAGYVIIGHSERRRLFGETDESVQKKVRAAIRAELVPIVCIGETLEEREGARMIEVLDRQIRVGLEGHHGRRARGPDHCLRAGVGDRHWQERRRPLRLTSRTGTSGRGCRSGGAPRLPASAVFSTAARSSPTTSGNCRPCPTWTARSSGARASMWPGFSRSSRGRLKGRGQRAQGRGKVKGASSAQGAIHASVSEPARTAAFAPKALRRASP